MGVVMKKWIALFILVFSLPTFAGQRVVVLEEFTSGT
jgi:hypothetical protein